MIGCSYSFRVHTHWNSSWGHDCELSAPLYYAFVLTYVVLAWCTTGLLRKTISDVLLWPHSKGLRCSWWGTTKIGSRTGVEGVCVCVSCSEFVCLKKGSFGLQAHRTSVAGCLGASEIWSYPCVLLLWRQGAHLEGATTSTRCNWRLVENQGAFVT